MLPYLPIVLYRFVLSEKARLSCPVNPDKTWPYVVLRRHLLLAPLTFVIWTGGYLLNSYPTKTAKHTAYPIALRVHEQGGFMT